MGLFQKRCIRDYKAKELTVADLCGISANRVAGTISAPYKEIGP